MQVLLDTSVLVAACVRDHPMFGRAFPILERVCTGDDRGSIPTHTISELHTVLSTFPVSPRIHPLEVQKIIQENVFAHFRVITLTGEDYKEAIADLAGGIRGSIHDVLFLRCADKFPCDRIYTFHVAEMQRIAPRLRDKIVAP